MTLKEKFKPSVFYVTDSFNVAREKDKEKNAEQCEKIADDYAIEYSEWLLKQFIFSLETGIDIEVDNAKEMLEIFKKEKGL